MQEQPFERGEFSARAETDHAFDRAMSGMILT
jgi:hypothetical protein